MRSLNIAFSLCLATVAVQASAQTVQLPTFSFTTVTTTVMVPDGGSAYLGGINSAATGRSEYGIPGMAFPGLQNRSIGQTRGSSSMFVTATIHDFDAMDEALLNSASNVGFSPPSRGLPGLLPDAPAAFAARAVPRQSINLAGNWKAGATAAAPKLPVSNLALEQADRQARKVVRSEEADDYFARGQQAEADGKPNVAKIYYQMAARRANGELKQQVLARLDAVSGRSSTLVQSGR